MSDTFYNALGNYVADNPRLVNVFLSCYQGWTFDQYRRNKANRLIGLINRKQYERWYINIRSALSVKLSNPMILLIDVYYGELTGAMRVYP